MKKSDVKQFTLDFSECRSIGEIYSVIKKEMELPEWFGANLDALWDSLVGIMYTPAQITVNKAVKNKELIEDVEEIISVMREAEEKYHEITVVIK